MILTDLEPLRGSSNKKTLYSTRSCVNWALCGIRGPLEQKKPNLHTNSLNKLLLQYKCGIDIINARSVKNWGNHIVR
jgi:hypothetical protein